MAKRIWLLLWAVVLTSFAGAQGRPVIEGSIRDQAGAVVVGAEVRLVTSSGEAIAQTSSNGEGQFQLKMPAGACKCVLRVQKAGYASIENSLEKNPASPMSLTLSVEKTITEVTVQGDTGYRLEQQTAATKLPIRMLDVPQSVYTIPQDLLRDKAATSMRDALAGVPGVSQILGEGRRDQVSIRGFSANTDQYVNGVKDDALYYRDLSNTDHIEVVSGPAAVLYGRGSSGGLVNRVTKKPRLEGNMGELAFMGGSYGKKRVEGDFDTLLGTNTLGFRTTGAYEEGGSFRHYFGLNRYAFAPTLRWKPAENKEGFLQVERLRDERLTDRGIPSLNGLPAPVHISNLYGYAAGDQIHSGVTAETGDWKQNLSNGWHLHEVVRHAGYLVGFQNTFANGLSGSKVLRSEYNGTQFQRNIFNQVEGWKRFHVAGMEHLLLIGAEYGRQTADRTQYTGTAASVDLYNPQQIAPVLATKVNTLNRFWGQTAAGYFQDQITLAAKWKALLGVRFDNYRQRQDDRTSANNDLGREDNAASPRVGLLYQPNVWSTIYTSWSHTFDPSGEGLSLATNNAQLKPEQTDNYEVGAKFLLLGDRLTATTAVYRLDRTNIKTTDQSNPNLLINIGEQRTDGAEIALSGKLAPHWRLTGGWAWMDAKIVSSNTLSNGVLTKGKRPQLIPVNSGSLWSVYELNNGLGFGLGVVGTGDRYAATDNLVNLPGFARADATIFYRTRRYDIDAHVENVGNHKYYETAQSDYQIMPGSPVDARVTVRMHF